MPNIIQNNLLALFNFTLTISLKGSMILMFVFTGIKLTNSLKATTANGGTQIPG